MTILVKNHIYSRILKPQIFQTFQNFKPNPNDFVDFCAPSPVISAGSVRREPHRVDGNELPVLRHCHAHDHRVRVCPNRMCPGGFSCFFWLWIESYLPRQVVTPSPREGGVCRPKLLCIPLLFPPREVVTGFGRPKLSGVRLRPNLSGDKVGNPLGSCPVTTSQRTIIFFYQPSGACQNVATGPIIDVSRTQVHNDQPPPFIKLHFLNLHS